MLPLRSVTMSRDYGTIRARWLLRHKIRNVKVRNRNEQYLNILYVGCYLKYKYICNTRAKNLLRFIPVYSFTCIYVIKYILNTNQCVKPACSSPVSASYGVLWIAPTGHPWLHRGILIVVDHCYVQIRFHYSSFVLSRGRSMSCMKSSS